MTRRRTRLLAPAALATVALIAAGCSSDPAERDAADGQKATHQSKALRFAACMRDHGINGFPDPDASGELTIDGVLNGSSLDPEGPAWKQAIGACKDLQPPGFTGDDDVSADERETRLEFARCMRDNGVEDFPDPGDGDPLVDTNRIPSAAGEAGMGVLNAAMQTCGDLAAEATGR